MDHLHYAWKRSEVAAMRRRELEAQAIGVLESLVDGGEIRSVAVAEVARTIVEEWQRMGERVAA